MKLLRYKYVMKVFDWSFFFHFQIKFAYNEKAQLQMENEKLRSELQKLSDQCHSSDDVVR